MASAVVPYDEIEDLLRIILQCYEAYTDVKLDRALLDYEFIPPRTGMKIGIEIKTKPPTVKRQLRVYVQFYRDQEKIEFTPFQQEELQNEDGTTTDQAEVSIASLPRALFPNISVIDNFEITVGPSSLLNNIQVGFNPTEYYSFGGNEVNLKLQINQKATGAIIADFDTYDVTAIADAEYVEKHLTNTTYWNTGDNSEKVIPVELLGPYLYFNWFSVSGYKRCLAFNRYVELLDNNRRIRSLSNQDNDLPYNGQLFQFASQYLPDDGTYYYEIQIDYAAESFNLKLQSAYYGNFTGANNTPNWELSPVNLSFISEMGQTDIPTFYIGAYQDDPQTGRNTQDLVPGIATFPVRIGFLTSDDGLKVCVNGKWWEPTDGTFKNTEAEVNWFLDVYSFNNYLNLDLKTIAPRRRNFYVYATKYFSETGINNAILDFKFITESLNQNYFPSTSGYKRYQGIIHQDHESQFSAQISSVTNATVTESISTILLDSLAHFSYNKIVVNQDRTNPKIAAPINCVTEDTYDYTRKFVPMVQWRQALPSSVVKTDLTDGYFDISPAGKNAIYPDSIKVNPYSETRYQRNTIKDYFIDFLDFPLDYQAGMSLVYQFKSLICFFDHPFGTNLYNFDYPDTWIDYNTPVPFFNSTYLNNNDGTYTVSTLLRFYNTGDGKKVIVPTPVNQAGSIDSIPPLFLYFEYEPARYVNLEMFNGTNRVVVICPYIEQPNVDYEDVLQDTSIRVYYTLDGSEPTTSSSYVSLFESTQPSGYGHSGISKNFIYFNIPIVGVPVPGNVTVKAFVVRNFWQQSSVITQTFGFFDTEADNFSIRMKIGSTSAPEIDPYQNPIGFYYRENPVPYNQFYFNGYPDTPGTIQYQHTTAEVGGTITGAITPWRDLTDNTVFTERILPSLETIRKFYDKSKDNFVLSTNFRLVQPNKYDKYIDTFYLRFNFDFYQADVRVDDNTNPNIFNELSYSFEGRATVINPEYSQVRGSLMARFGSLGYNERRLVLDDFRYAEIYIEKISVPYLADPQILIGDYILSKNGDLTSNNVTVNTGLTWTEKDTIRVQLNLNTGGFLMAVNNGLWSDHTSGSFIAPDKLMIAVQFPNPTLLDIVGTSVFVKTRASQFKYAVPNNNEPLDNYLNEPLDSYDD